MRRARSVARRSRHYALLAAALLFPLVLAGIGPASAQSLSQRGFVEVGTAVFPQDASADRQNTIVDLRIREELFAKPRPWLGLAGGVDLRGNTHQQVERSWRLDVSDRRLLRPALAIRRLSATLRRGLLTADVGKQFIRWGKTDIVTPTDHFAPRDFMGVIDTEFLAVTGARAVAQVGNESVDVVWVPRFTPSRMPLIDQRWTVLPPEAAGLVFVQAPPRLPARDQFGIRWGHTGRGYDLSVSAFDGVNHLPNVTTLPTASPREVLLMRDYPLLRSYGADAAIPTRWFTLKGEAAWFDSPDRRSDEFVLYVVQVERQTGEWLLLAGYAGEAMTERRTAMAFAPDRGLTRALVGRVSYTIDTNRSAAFETALRQNGRGAYAKGEYSQARGQHWRVTVAGVAIGGRQDDFLGQYRRNSHLTLSLRYSF